MWNTFSIPVSINIKFQLSSKLHIQNNKTMFFGAFAAKRIYLAITFPVAYWLLEDSTVVYIQSKRSRYKILLKTSKLKPRSSIWKLLLPLTATTINYGFLSLWSLTIDFLTIQGKADSSKILNKYWWNNNRKA